MTEARQENRASSIINRESASGPVVAKTAPATTKLNASAKSFVFNTAAPAWTPSFVTPAATSSTPAPTPTPAPVVAPVAATPITPSSPAIVPAAAPIAAASPVLKAAAAPIVVASPKLKAEAKPFIPSFLAKPFVPSFTTAAPAAATAAEPAQPEEASVEADSGVADAAATVVIGTQTVSLESSAVETTTTETTETTTESTETETSTESPAVVAEQAAIGARLLYSIAKLLELEPEHCPMPPSVVGLPVAAETTGKASDAAAASSATESTGKATRGHGSSNGRRNGGDAPSSRSLHRTNSESSNRGGGRNNNNSNNSRRGGRNGHHHNVHDTAPALEDCEPLAINEATRWKPKTREATTNNSATDTDALDAADGSDATAAALAAVTDASLKEAKAILNKLSIEKFEKLSNELIAVAVRSIDVLVGVIEMIVTKAKMEWHFSTMYAELCTKMARTQMPAVVVPATQTAMLQTVAAATAETIELEAAAVVVEDTHKLFRRLLLQRCEREFREAPSRDGLETLAPDDAAEKELLLKRGVLGHIRFVGELFKLEMIKARIMHQCIANLFGDVPAQQRDEEALECLTKLLTTIGDVFEATARSDGERAAIAQYYAVIKVLATAAPPAKDASEPQAPQLSTRVRFMLQDLLELRKNRWVARREEAKATTIAQVHADAKREADAKARASASGASSSSSSHAARLQRSQSMHVSSDRRRTANGTSGGASDAWKARAAASQSTAAASTAPAVDADGWETVASGRPRLLKSRSSTDRLPLPPQSSSSSNNANNAGGRPPKSATQAPATAAAATKSDSRRSDRDRSGSASSSSTGSSLRRGHSMSDFGRSSTSSTRSSPVKMTPPSTATSTKSNGTAAAKQQLSPAAFDEQVQSVFTDFCVTRDIDDAIQCINALASRQHHARIATHVLNVGLEKGHAQRTAASELLAALHLQQVVTTDELVQPLDELLEIADDLEIDIPLTLTYVADMIAPSVASGAMPLARVVNACQSHLAASGKAAVVIAKTLTAIGDTSKARTLASAANLDLLPLLAATNRNDDALRAFCESANVSFLLEE